MYDPIYSQNIGLCGFRCRVGACTKVVRTYRGIMMHCLRVHKMRAQMEFPYNVKENSNGEAENASERIVRSAGGAERAVLLANGAAESSGSSED